MNDQDLKNVSDLISGKTAIQVEIPTATIIYFSIGILLAVLLGVMIANELTRTK